MKYFIFRNNTLENLFGTTDVGYSGYDDISYVPLEVDSYVWFYQVPIKFDIDSLTEEVNGYFDKLQIVYKQLPAHSQLIVFSLENLYNLNFCSTNYELKNSIIKFNMDIRDFCNAYANVKFIDFSEFLSDSMPLNSLLSEKFILDFRRRRIWYSFTYLIRGKVFRQKG